jgi:hypothetical protein
MSNVLDLQEVYNFFHLASVTHLLTVGPRAVKKTLKGIGLHVNMPTGQKVVNDTEAREKLYALKGTGYAELSSFVRLERGNLTITKEDLPFLGMVKSIKTVQKTRLARAIRTNDRKYFTVAHIDIDILERVNTIKR